MTQDGLNNGDNTIGYDSDDTHCPQCGRETLRGLFIPKAYCPVCDSSFGDMKKRLSLVEEVDNEQ